MTEKEIKSLVEECGLEWRRGYIPLFHGDPTNRYAVLVEAASAPLLARIEKQQAHIDQLVQEVAAGADVEAAQRGRIAELEQDNASLREQNDMQDKALAELEAKLAQRVPEVLEMAAKHFELRDAGAGGFYDPHEPAEILRTLKLSAAPAAPEHQDQSEQHLGMFECRHCGGTGDAPYMTTSPVPYQRTEKCATCDGAGMVAQAPNAQQAEPPPWWPAVENILNEYGLQAFDFVADFKKAQQAEYVPETNFGNIQQAEAQEPYGQVTTHSITGQHFFYRWPERPYLDNASECATLFTRPQPAQLQALSDAKILELIEKYWNDPTITANVFARIVQSALAAKNGVELK